MVCYFNHANDFISNYLAAASLWFDVRGRRWWGVTTVYYYGYVEVICKNVLWVNNIYEGKKRKEKGDMKRKAKQGKNCDISRSFMTNAYAAVKSAEEILESIKNIKSFFLPKINGFTQIL
jgi:hypothetical protein